MTSEEAEKQSKTDISTYYKTMFINVIIGSLSIIFAFFNQNILLTIVGILWIIVPYIMFKISQIHENKEMAINEEDKKYLIDIAKLTWQFFKDYLTKENNYLMPDNYQQDRKPIVVSRTSSTNIGLSLLAVISSYDLKFENLEDTLNLLEKIINCVYNLPKWNGHLYNWYNIKTKEPLYPRYVSTVDSGNLVGYMYTTKTFLQDILDKNKDKQELNDLIEKLDKMIEETDFKILYRKC